MSSAPRFKLYDPSGGYVAAFKHPEDAALVLAAYGAGARLRDRGSGHRIVWTEGQETIGAGDSEQDCAAIIWGRIRAYATAAPYERLPKK